MSHFFDQIIYSSANEDPLSELNGLKLNASDNVFCITGSGARVLDLLTQADCSITAVDFNVKQNYLLELKMAALNNLEYDAMLDFLGIRPCHSRLDLFKKIKGDLSSEAALFWQGQGVLIKAGVLYQGVWEQYMRHIAKLLSVKRKTAEKLFSCRSLQEQKDLWYKEWKSIYWFLLISLLGKRFIWKYLMKEPGINFVPKDFAISAYLNDKFDHIASTQLFAFNPYLNLIFNSCYHNDCLPIHLQEKHYNTIKGRIKNITMKQGSIEQILSTSPASFTAFSLSDFSSYSTKEHYDATWESIVRAAKNGARFVERSFLVRYDLAAEITNHVCIDKSLSQELSRLDHSFIYDIYCGSIHKPKNAV